MFLVRTLKINEVPDGELFEIHDVIPYDRAPGYFRKLDEAFECISRNRGDIFEDGFYNYAVITFIEEGLYANSVEQQWFKMTRNNEVIAIIEYHKRPEEIGEYKPYIIG